MGLEGLEGTMRTWCSEMTELGRWRTGDAISHDVIYTVLDTHIYCMYLFIWKYKYIFLHIKVDFFIRTNSRRCFEIVAKLFFLYELLITAMILWRARKIVISYCKCMKNAIRLCDFNRFVSSTFSRNGMLHSIFYRPLNQVLSLKSLFCLI